VSRKSKKRKENVRICFFFQEFLEDIAHFKHFLKDIELKLAAIINQAFDDSNSLISQFKLVSILGSMLERPTIHDAFFRNYARLTLAVEHEIDACHEIYERQMEFKEKHGTIELHRNQPPIAGSLEVVRRTSTMKIDEIFIKFRFSLGSTK
jgi:dynein heavy chain